MIKTDINKIEKGDTYLVLPGNNKYINLAIGKGIKKLIVSEGNYHIPYLKVSNTRYYLNEYLKRYNKLFNDLYIILVYGNNSDAISYILYKMLYDKKVAYISSKEFYKRKKVCDISSLEIDDIYYMLISCVQNNYKYIIMNVNTEMIEKLNPLNVDMIIFNDFDKNVLEGNLILNMLFSLLKKNGTSIINGDSLYKDNILTKKIITYGFNDNDYKIINYTLSKELTIFKLKNKNKTYHIKTNTIGISNMYVLTSSFITLLKLGISSKKIIDEYKNINIPYYMESIKYKDSYIIINKINDILELRKIIKEIKYYNYNNIYCMVNIYNTNVNNYLNYHVNSIYEYDTNNKEIVLKKILNNLKINDLLLILELENKEIVNT